MTGVGSALLSLEESLTDSPHYRSKVREYEEYANNLEVAIQGLAKASRGFQQSSSEYSNKSVDLLHRVSKISKLSPVKDPLVEKSLAGFGDVIGEIDRNRMMQNEQFQHILVSPMEEMAEGGLLQKVRGERRRLDMLQAEYESQLTKLMAKKAAEPMIEQQEQEVETLKSRYINQMQLMSLDLNRIASVKKVEFLECFLSLMYAQYAFYHQAYSSLKDFEPIMRQLGEHIAKTRKEAEAEINEAEQQVVPPHNFNTGDGINSLSFDDDGYVQVGQSEDDGAFGSVKSIEALGESLDAVQIKNARAFGITNSTSLTKDGFLATPSMAAAKLSTTSSESAKSPRSTHRRKASKTHRKSLASISLSPNGLFQISGYLFLRSQYSLMSSWQRRWFEIKDGHLVHFQRLDAKDKEMIPLHLCKVKRGSVQDRRNVFELIAPTRTYLLQAESNNELNAWKACLKQSIEASLYSHSPISQAIKGVHVSKVRSVKLDNWEPELMQIMHRLGNRHVNQTYEAVDPSPGDPQRPTSQTPRESKLPYLVQKYANRLWVAKPESQELANEKLIQATRLADMPMALEALAQGANVNAHDAKSGSTPLIEAVAMGDFGMLELLFLWGADPNTRAKMTATEYMADSPSCGNDKATDSNESASTKHSANGVESTPKLAGGTALHFASRLGNVRVVWYLVRRGAAWDTPDVYGLLPLDIALEDSNVQVVMALRYAAFQKASGIPPGTLGSSRQRHHVQGNGSGEPVDMLDMDDSFIRDWAIPPFSPHAANGQQEQDSVLNSTQTTPAPAAMAQSRTSGEFTDFVDSSAHANAPDDADFDEPPAADDDHEERA
ncbi:hypothetical protein GGI12_004661 [Dipsacomyces acuminosporus]|nr:hypothetical protein GGI12_004661 [Dipsacomyces acuminosporus]